MSRCPEVSSHNPSSERLRGTVKWFNASNGYGFIIVKDSTDVFVHQTNIKVEHGQVLLETGQEVEFTMEISERGREALDVTMPGGVPFSMDPLTYHKAFEQNMRRPFLPRGFRNPIRMDGSNRFRGGPRQRQQPPLMQMPQDNGAIPYGRGGRGRSSYMRDACRIRGRGRIYGHNADQVAEPSYTEYPRRSNYNPRSRRGSWQDMHDWNYHN